MDFIRNKTAKLRSLGKRLLTRRSINRIAPAPVEELAALDPTAPALSPRQASLSPRTKVVTHIQKTFRKRKRRTQALADLSKINSKRRATRRIQKKFRKALANPNLEECPICYGTMLYPRLTKTIRCGHKFHRKCIEQWNATNSSCPLCRTSIEPEIPYHLQRYISIPISTNINNTVNTINALIAGLANVATMIEAIGLINETDVLINSLPESERAVFREARNQVWLQTYPRLQEAPRQSRATIDAINRANVLIDNMSRATTFDNARRSMDASTRVINTLPRNGNAYRELADRQWDTWLQAHRRLSAPIQTQAPISVNGITTAAYNRSRANVQPISVNGITTAAYNRSMAPISVNGITTAAYNRSMAPISVNRITRAAYNRSMAPISVNRITRADYNRSTQLDTRPTTGITPDEYNRLVRGMYY
jgi:hypothetical protein